MNNSRRDVLREVISVMEELKNVENNKAILEKLEQAGYDLDIAYDEEQEAYDNMPENLMFSRRADDWSDNASNLLDASIDILDVIDAYKENDDNPYHKVESKILSVIKNCTEAIER